MCHVIAISILFSEFTKDYITLKTIETSLSFTSGREAWADETYTGGAGGSDPTAGQIEAVEMSPPPPDSHLTGLLVHASSTDTHIHTHTCIHMYTRSYSYHQIANPFFPCLHIQNPFPHFVSLILLTYSFTLAPTLPLHLINPVTTTFATYANLHLCWQPFVTLVYSHSLTYSLVSCHFWIMKEVRCLWPIEGYLFPHNVPHSIPPLTPRWPYFLTHYYPKHLFSATHTSRNMAEQASIKYDVAHLYFI